LSRPVLAPGSALLPYTTLFRSLGAPPAALPWGSQDRVHPHHRLPRRTVPDARGRRVRDRRLGRLVQQPAPPWHARDAHPDRVRDAPLRGPHPRARTHKVAAENLGRFRASAETNVKGPASSRGRWRNCSTCSSNDSAILLTCDFESELMPRVFTSLSMRRVETPAR